MIVGEWFPPAAGSAGAPPEPAAPSPADQPLASPLEGLPGPAPEASGGWYTPADAQLDALLSGASDTIIEQPDVPVTGAFADRLARARADAKARPLDGQPPADDDVTQIGEVSGTQAQEFAGEGWTATDADTVVLPGGKQPAGDLGDEPAPPPGSTPVSQDTPAEPGGLTPAELAFLAEQRRGEAQAAGGDGDEPETQAPADESAAAGDQPDRAAPFREVERKVNILRQRYQAGSLTRDELQNELRNLMILDDDGRWWMLGLESNRWYYYDGKDWVPATPPGYDEEAVRGDYLRTETGLQEVAVGAGAAIDAANIPLDEDGMPLPERVPQDDPSATLVSPNAPFMDPIRRSEAPTLQGSGQVLDPALLAGGVIEGVTQPTRPDTGMGGDVTLPSGVVVPGAEETLPHGIPVPGAAASGVTVAGAAAVGAAAEAISKPKPKLGDFPQPDYSAALGYSHNRSTYTRWAIRGAIFAVIGGMALTLFVLVGIIGYYFYKVNQYAGAVAELSERAADFETTLILDSEGTTLAEFSDYSQADSGAHGGPAERFALADPCHHRDRKRDVLQRSGLQRPGDHPRVDQNLRAGDTVSGASTIAAARPGARDRLTSSARPNADRGIIVASEIKRSTTRAKFGDLSQRDLYGNRAYGIEAAAQTYSTSPLASSTRQRPPSWPGYLNHRPPRSCDQPRGRHSRMHRSAADVRAVTAGCIRIEHQDTTEWAVPNRARCASLPPRADGSVYFYKTPNMAEPVDMVLDIANVEIAAYRAPELSPTPALRQLRVAAA